jgi:preprotein translocase subunit SecF
LGHQTRHSGHRWRVASHLGGDYKQYLILADPQKLDAYGITMADLEQVGKTFSNNSEGGVIRDFGNEYALRGMARTTDLDELGATFIKRVNGCPVRVSDVAEVVVGSAVKMGTASQNASPSVILAVAKQPNINTLSVTEKIETNLEEIRKSLPSDVRLDTHIFRQADFIETSVNNVGRALLEGAIFVIIILFLFLKSFRTTVISVIAIPLSLLGTIAVLHLLGMDINTMTLGGMCIAIGSLVDDAIIDVENVYKRLRQNLLKPSAERESAFTVVFEASKEIRSSVINATFIIMVAFVPLFFLSGMEGRMLKPLGIAYIIALFMSLLVAMTLTPLLCKMMLSDEEYLSKNEEDSRLTQWLTKGYSKMLAWVLQHQKTVISLTIALLIGALVLFFTMGRSFLPDFNEGSAVISAVTAPGVSLDVSDELGNLIERELMKIPEVTGTARRTGRGELDEHAQSVNSAELDVQFTLKDRSREEVFNDIRERLASIPGIATTVGQPLGHRIDHMHHRHLRRSASFRLGASPECRLHQRYRRYPQGLDSHRRRSSRLIGGGGRHCFHFRSGHHHPRECTAQIGGVGQCVGPRPAKRGQRCAENHREGGETARRLPRGVRRAVRERTECFPHPPHHHLVGSFGHLYVALRRVPQRIPVWHCAHQSAPDAYRWRIGGPPHLWGGQHPVHHRVHHAVWCGHPQRHPAHFTLSASWRKRPVAARVRGQRFH